jgi:hypothetical protein
VVEWAESKDFRGCPLQHTVSELTDAAHPARAIAHGQREWFTERFPEWTTTAGVKDAKTTARALMVLFDGAVAGSEVAAASEGRSMDGQEVVGRLNAHALPASTERRSLHCGRAAAQFCGETLVWVLFSPMVWWSGFSLNRGCR